MANENETDTKEKQMVTEKVAFTEDFFRRNRIKSRTPDDLNGSLKIMQEEVDKLQSGTVQKKAGFSQQPSPIISEINKHMPTEFHDQLSLFWREQVADYKNPKKEGEAIFDASMKALTDNFLASTQPASMAAARPAAESVEPARVAHVEAVSAEAISAGGPAEVEEAPALMFDQALPEQPLVGTQSLKEELFPAQPAKLSADTPVAFSSTHVLNQSENALAQQASINGWVSKSVKDAGATVLKFQHDDASEVELTRYLQSLQEYQAANPQVKIELMGKAKELFEKRQKETLEAAAPHKPANP